MGLQNKFDVCVFVYLNNSNYPFCSKSQRNEIDILSFPKRKRNQKLTKANTKRNPSMKYKYFFLIKLKYLMEINININRLI